MQLNRSWILSPFFCLLSNRRILSQTVCFVIKLLKVLRFVSHYNFVYIVYKIVQNKGNTIPKVWNIFFMHVALVTVEFEKPDV